MENHKILLVEDDNLTRILYQKMLESNSFEVDSVENGLDGLKLAQNGGYALIILDVMLPGMDGLTILSRLKDQPPTNPNGIIVVTSNLANEKIFSQATSFGVKEFIVKSDCTPIEVVERVKNILKAAENN
jgi:DNA-binding response OmpR family regulator